MVRAQQVSRRPVASLSDEIEDEGAEPHWWLRLTSSGWDTPDVSLEEREMTRRSRLLSWIVVGIVACAALLAAGGLRDPATLIAAAATIVGTLAVLALNRAGFVSAAATLLVALVIGALLGAVVKEPGHLLDTVNLPAYDLLAVAVIIAASVLPRGSAFVVAVINVGLICGDYVIQPKSVDLLKWQDANGTLWLLARPIALQLVVATVAFLWVRGADDALRRADRAQELAALEHAFAEQRRQLEVGAKQILETHVRAANGDYSARAPLSEENILWQIAASLNNLLSRLQRTGAADHQLRRTEEELRRLATAMDDARLGRRAIWPVPSGTAADLILERLPAARAAWQMRQTAGALAAIPSATAPHRTLRGAALNPPSLDAPSYHQRTSSHLPAIQPPAMQRANQSGQLGQLPAWLQELMAEPSPGQDKPTRPLRAVTPPLATPHATPHPTLRTPPGQEVREPSLHGAADATWWGASATGEMPAVPLPISPMPPDTLTPGGGHGEIDQDWPEFLRPAVDGKSGQALLPGGGMPMETVEAGDESGGEPG